tara:strand:- start:66 stop:530 length:465 start_codon:yes stop_codon:yes gene_type:complete
MKKIYLIIIFILVTNCSIEKVSKHHGIYHLENKHQKLILSKTNKNDIISLLGPPSTTGTFDNDLWIYVEMEKSNTSLFTLGNKKIIKNNVLILEIDDKGLLAKKNFLNIDKMNDIKFTEVTTSNIYKKNTFVYEFLSSMRQRLNDPLGKRKKVD